MKSFKYFKKQIYDRWKPTTKIFFWLGVVSGLVSVASLILSLYPIENFGDKIKISPAKILLAENNKNFSPTFYVTNNTDEVINQIWLKLTLSSNDISLRNEDITVKLISDDTRMSLDVPVSDSETEVNLSDYMTYVGAIDSSGKQAFFMFRNQLAPKEMLQIQISNNYPKRLQGEHFFKASFLNSSDEPVEIFTNKEGPLEITFSAIGEEISIFRSGSIIRANVTP